MVAELKEYTYEPEINISMDESSFVTIDCDDEPDGLRIVASHKGEELFDIHFDAADFYLYDRLEKQHVPEGTIDVEITVYRNIGGRVYPLGQVWKCSYEYANWDLLILGYDSDMRSLDLAFEGKVKYSPQKKTVEFVDFDPYESPWYGGVIDYSNSFVPFFKSSNDITISGTVNAEIPMTFFCCDGTMRIAENSNFNITSNYYDALYAKSMVVEGGDLNVRSNESNAIFTETSLSFGSKVKSVTASARSDCSAITCLGGKITISNKLGILVPEGGNLGSDAKNVYKADKKTIATTVKIGKATPTPTKKPATPTPTNTPSPTPTKKPTNTPTKKPTNTPTKKPTNTPTKKPTNTPTKKPTNTPTKKPTNTPTKKPTNTPTKKPTNTPTKKPTNTQTKKPTNTPTKKPTATPTIKVSAPSNVKTKGSSPTTVDISWTPAPNTDFVQVWRTHKANAQQSDYVLLGTYYASDGKSISKALTPNKTYYYKLRSYKKLSNGTKVYSGYSTVVSATPKVDAPTGLKVTATTSDSISLSWNKVNGTSIFYQVWRIDNPNNLPGACLGRYTTTSKVSTNLKSGTTYYYRVRAYYYYKDADGTEHRIYSGYTPIVSAKTK